MEHHAPMADVPIDRPSFFDRGLRFACRRCGRCCTGSPGRVWVDRQELAAIARLLEASRQQVRSRFCRTVEGRLALKEKANGDCIFYRDGCRIYACRPLQCRTFPFWFSLLRSAERWRRAAADCPGIGNGPVYSKQQILEAVHQTMALQMTAQR